MASVAEVLEDLVLLLQPPSASPARIKVNNIGFFIRQIEFRSETDLAGIDRVVVFRW